jgi:hypothetical protein
MSMGTSTVCGQVLMLGVEGKEALIIEELTVDGVHVCFLWCLCSRCYQYKGLPNYSQNKYWEGAHSYSGGTNTFSKRTKPTKHGLIHKEDDDDDDDKYWVLSHLLDLMFFVNFVLCLVHKE